MVRPVSTDRVSWVSGKTKVETVTVEKVLTADREYSSNHKRQPRPPAPDGGITIRGAAKKYGIDNSTLWHWVKKGYIRVILRTKNETYILEDIAAKLIQAYKEAPGQGKWTIRKLVEDCNT